MIYLEIELHNGNDECMEYQYYSIAEAEWKDMDIDELSSIMNDCLIRYAEENMHMARGYSRLNNSFNSRKDFNNYRDKCWYKLNVLNEVEYNQRTSAEYWELLKPLTE